MSGPLLSKDQTETFLPLVLWEADWTFQSPMKMVGGGWAIAAAEEAEWWDGPGVADRLADWWTLYAWAMFDLAKKDEAAAKTESIAGKRVVGIAAI
jgi:hypothetical protein